MKKNLLLIVFCTLALISCGNKNANEKAARDVAFQEQCNQTIEKCRRLENAVNDLSSSSSAESIYEVQQLNEGLAFNYDASSLDSAQLARAKEVDRLIADVKVSIAQHIDQIVRGGYWYMVNQPELLLTEQVEYPMYLERGEKLFVEITTEKPADIRIYNVNSHQVLRSYLGKTFVGHFFLFCLCGGD